MTLTNYLKPPKNPLDSTKPLELPSTLFEKMSEENAIWLSNNPPKGITDANSWRAAVLTRYAQNNLADKNREVAGKIVKEFNEWLLGKHPLYNRSNPPATNATWWGKRRLVGDDIDIYFTNIVGAQSDFIKKLTLLRGQIPENLPDAWLYFVFFVYDWPNMPDGWTPDKMFFDEIKMFYDLTKQGGNIENQKWPSIRDGKQVWVTAHDENGLPEYITSVLPQNSEARPRFIGGQLSTKKLVKYQNRRNPNLGNNGGGGSGGGDDGNLGPGNPPNGGTGLNPEPNVQDIEENDDDEFQEVREQFDEEEEEQILEPRRNQTDRQRDELTQNIIELNKGIDKLFDVVSASNRGKFFFLKKKKKKKKKS
jgi:hypothetical protein